MKRFTLSLLFLPILLSFNLESCWLLPTPTEEWEVASVQYWSTTNILRIYLANINDLDSYEYYKDSNHNEAFEFYDAFYFDDLVSRIMSNRIDWSVGFTYYNTTPP
jgi:hypothetical protein